MGIGQRFSAEYRVRFDEAGPDGRLRASGYLRYAQDLAWRHSEAAGFDRAWFRARRMHWLVRAVCLEVVGAALYGETVHVSTEVCGWRRVWVRRESSVRVGGPDGPLAARAHIDWVLLRDDGRPVRVPEEIARLLAPGATFRPHRVDLGPAPESAMQLRSRVRPQDLDPMGHVNNATYIDYLEETLLAAGALPELPDRLPRRYLVEYLRPALPGGDLAAAGWPDGGEWAYRLRDERGDELVRARFSSRAGSDERPVAKILS